MKLKLVGDNEAWGAVPVPVRDTVCGLSTALSVMLTVPTKLPAIVGVKVTEIVQLDPAGSDPGQLLVTAKFSVALMLLI